MSKLVKLIILVVVVCGAVYFGITLYANFTASDGKIDLPKYADAKYTVTIENTGGFYLTNKYELIGKSYILHGFFELSGRDFKYRDRDLVLNQAIYGPINIRTRTPTK